MSIVSVLVKTSMRLRCTWDLWHKSAFSIASHWKNNALSLSLDEKDRYSKVSKNVLESYLISYLQLIQPGIASLIKLTWFQAKLRLRPYSCYCAINVFNPYLPQRCKRRRAFRLKRKDDVVVLYPVGQDLCDFYRDCWFWTLISIVVISCYLISFGNCVNYYIAIWNI
jgi:hypothetical protein